MKFQDIGFLLVYLILLYFRKPKLLISLALVFMILSIPLYGFWVFFTAQRLVVYSFILLTTACILLLFKKR